MRVGTREGKEGPLSCRRGSRMRPVGGGHYVAWCFQIRAGLSGESTLFPQGVVNRGRV